MDWTERVFFALVSGIIFIVVIGRPTFGIRWIKQYRRRIDLESKLNMYGITTTGRINYHCMIRGGKHLAYTYEHNGNTYQNKQLINRQDFYAWKDGSEVRIRYLPDDPTAAILEDISHARSIKNLKFRAIFSLSWEIIFILVVILYMLWIWVFAPVSLR